MKILNYTFSTIIFLAIIDMTIVLWTMLQIAHGAPTPHLPFWDTQIKAVLSLMQ